MDLKKMIDEMVAGRVKDVLASMLSSEESNNAIARRIADDSENESERPYKARKRGRGRAKVAYLVTAYKGRGRRPMPHMFPTLEATWDAIKAAKGPITAREIESASGLGKKTVESCVFQLRTHKLIKSVPMGEQ